MVEVEPHVMRTIAQVPDHELRQLAAGMLQRLINIDAAPTVMQFFPALAPHWCEPFNWLNANVTR
jgi:hypothetical protein